MKTSTDTTTSILSTATAMGWTDIAEAIESGDSSALSLIAGSRPWAPSLGPNREAIGPAKIAYFNAAAAAENAVRGLAPFETLGLMNDALARAGRGDLAVEPAADARASSWGSVLAHYRREARPPTQRAIDLTIADLRDDDRPAPSVTDTPYR